MKVIQVDLTVIPNPDKLKDINAADFVQDSLRDALRNANFEVGSGPVRAHIVLDEINSGNTAARVMLGGSKTVECRVRSPKLLRQLASE